MAGKEFGFTATEIEDLLGHEAAEDSKPTRLREFFFGSPTFDEVNDESQLRVLVAHKGVGKSAMFTVSRMLQTEKKRVAIKVPAQEIVDIPVSPDSGFVRKADEWKRGLRAAVAKSLCRERLNITGPHDVESIASTIRSRGLGLHDAIKSGGVIWEACTPESRAELTPLATDGGVIVYIDDLDLGWHYSSGAKSDIERIATLFHALREMKSEEPLLRFRVAIRTDIFYLVSTAYVDMGKMRQDCRWYRWDNHSILAMFVKRIMTYRATRLNETSSELLHSEQDLLLMANGKLGTHLTFLMEPTFEGRGAWLRAPIYKVLLTMIRKRPRDLVALLNIASEMMRGRVAGYKSIKPQLRRILAVDLIEAFPRYSQEIFKDTITEYRGELPGIELLIRAMGPTREEIDSHKGKGFVFTTEQILQKLKFLIGANVFGDHRNHFAPTPILESGDEPARSPTRTADVLAATRDLTSENLLEFLYRINFLVVRKPRKGGIVQREYFDESRFDVAGLTVDLSANWEIHPAYRWVLSSGSAESIHEEIDLMDE